MKTPKFCKDCRYFKHDDDGLHRCLHERATIKTTDLVMGEIIVENLACHAMRTRGGVCGEEGSLWTIYTL